MMSKINARQMEQMMRSLGIKSETLNVREVIFRCDDKDIVVRNPSVQRINIPGQGETFQVAGKSEDVPHVTHKSDEPTDEDIALVAEKTGCSHEAAKKALKETGDIAEAIMKLS